MCLEEYAVQHGSCGKMNDQVMYLFLDIYYSGNKNLHIHTYFTFLSCIVNQHRTWAKVVIFICAQRNVIRKSVKIHCVKNEAFHIIL